MLLSFYFILLDFRIKEEAAMKESLKEPLKEHPSGKSVLFIYTTHISVSYTHLTLPTICSV